MLPCGLMECRVQVVGFRKHIKGGENIKHKARIVTYVDPAKKKAKVISLLTNDMTMEVEDIIDIYRQRWEIDNTCRVSRLFRIFLSANAQYAGIALSWKWLIDDNLNLFLLLSTHS